MRISFYLYIIQYLKVNFFGAVTINDVKSDVNNLLRVSFSVIMERS